MPLQALQVSTLPANSAQIVCLDI